MLNATFYVDFQSIGPDRTELLPRSISLRRPRTAWRARAQGYGVDMCWGIRSGDPDILLLYRERVERYGAGYLFIRWVSLS